MAKVDGTVKDITEVTLKLSREEAEALHFLTGYTSPGNEGGGGAQKPIANIFSTLRSAGVNSQRLKSEGYHLDTITYRKRKAQTCGLGYDNCDCLISA